MVSLPRIRLYRITQQWHGGESVIVEASSRRDAVTKANLRGGRSEWLTWATVSKTGRVLDEYGECLDG